VESDQKERALRLFELM
jgi:hypothetical protein